MVIQSPDEEGNRSFPNENHTQISQANQAQHEPPPLPQPQPSTILKPDENSAILGNQSPGDNDLSIEKSYVVESLPSSSMSEQASVASQETNPCQETTPTTPPVVQSPSTAAGADEQSNSKPRSNSNSSLASRFKRSGDFLTKLQPSSTSDKNHSTVASGFANALSSFSSLASSISRGPSIGRDASNTSRNLTIETSSNSLNQSLGETSRDDFFLKRAATERSNLISLTKLIVRDLISSSLKASRTIDDASPNAVHLSNYFTLIDRVLKHGLKQNLLSSKSASLWNALENLPKYLKESTLMSESVRSLANAKTPDGKIKAWVRLAMMQKKLPEYFNELLVQKNVLLKDIYYDYALMLNDEAHMFAGLIIGVNVIDCNVFVKDANFDSMNDIIDLKPYLRASNSFDEEPEGELEQISGESGQNFMAALDQKNYLEEFNKRLESNINVLQTKVKQLQEQNSRLEMEAKLNLALITKLQEKRTENTNVTPERPSLMPGLTEAIRNLMSSDQSSAIIIEEQTAQQYRNARAVPRLIDQSRPFQQMAAGAPDKQADITQPGEANKSSTTKKDNDSEASSSLRQRSISQSSTKTSQGSVALDSEQVQREKILADLKERVSILEASYRDALEKIKILERDLDVQTSMNADKETTIMIFEKDIKEKQAQVEMLRSSLNDAKKLNSDLNERLSDVSKQLKERVRTVSVLQTNLDKWKIENKALAARLQDKQAALRSVTAELEKASKSNDELKKYNERINDDLKCARETGHSSSVTVETQNAKIAELNEKLVALGRELHDVKPFKEKTEELAKRCKDYEQSLEEIGAQLRESRLEVENLRENSAVFTDSQWVDSKQVKNCHACDQTFSVTRRKHHCRLCGNVFCQTCSDNKMELASSAKPVRVCDTCHSFLLAKFVKASAAK